MKAWKGTKKDRAMRRRERAALVKRYGASSYAEATLLWLDDFNRAIRKAAPSRKGA